MAKQSTFTADQAERLDVFLARMLPNQSRSYVQKLCREGLVAVAGSPQTKPGAVVQAGDVVVVTLPEQTPVPIEIPILYEDADVLVLNKPAGVLTHAKGALSQEFTVADFVRPRTSDAPESNRPGIVHRLDRGTSGVIIAAKTPEAKQWLQKQFSQRKVKKMYVALVNGHPKEPAARIELPIGRNPKKPQTFRVGGNGKPAVTNYETERSFSSATLLNLSPHTGRTHQLRVHLQYIGCPIVGDSVYGTPEPTLGRMFLHAQSLEITLPSRERKTFTAPLPPELSQYLKGLT